MDARSNAAPVIIKRKKVVGGGGHHGGAWKVAYADFVTAMMAFFLLMWLMGATTEQQRKGIADYFSPSLPISRISGGGDGAFGGDNIFSEDGHVLRNAIGASDLDTTVQRPTRGKIRLAADEAPSPLALDDANGFEAVENALRALSGESMVDDETLRHIVTRITDEGLVIEIFDLEGAQLFIAGTTDATPLLQEIAALIASVSGLVENRIAVAGYTRARPITLARNPVWDLSTARANQMRLLLETTGVTRNRMQRVTGHADRAPATHDPMALRNNRLEVILLRSDREVK